MTERKKFAAALSRYKGRPGLCMIFRHPCKVDRFGQPGKRYRVGLDEREEAKAQKLVDQMNAILQDESLWVLAKQETARRLYDERVVAAFYRYIEPQQQDSWTVRDEAIHLPTPAEGYARVLLLGTFGAGKTTLVRQLLGTDPRREGFPSVSASRTTTFDTEIIQADGPFEAVVTFRSEDVVRQLIEESLSSAALAHLNGAGFEEVARKMLEHSEQRFRLGYVLGYPNLERSPEDDEEGLDDEVEHQEVDVDDLAINEQARLGTEVEAYIKRLQEIATAGYRELAQKRGYADDGAAEEDRDGFMAEVDDLICESEGFNELADIILDEIRKRFTFQREGMEWGRAEWPSLWRLRTDDRRHFIRAVNWFCSNHASRFGRLLTPVVDGIRVRGPLVPGWLEPLNVRFVFMDGEGLGHSSKAATSVSTEIENRYPRADAILLVDGASQPLQAAPVAALQSLITSGHVSKLVICFTHFDQVKGANLPNVEARKAHLRSSLDNAVDAIAKALGSSSANALSGLISKRVFWFSNLQNPPKEVSQFTANQLAGLVRILRELALPPEAVEAAPVYIEANLILCVQKAAQEFHEAWWPRLRSEHWTRIKALARRIALRWSDEYDTLRPVADLRTRLRKHVYVYLANPLRWKPETASEQMRLAAVNRVAQEFDSRLKDFTSNRIIVEQVNEWVNAYGHSGFLSASRRAKDIEKIYDSAVPVLDEIPTRDAATFFSLIRSQVREAITAAGGEIVNE
jgi:energy-coupling factor transporter ATP-binding protein EcfA2